MRALVPIIICPFICFRLFAQTDVIQNSYQNLDTLKTYAIKNLGKKNNFPLPAQYWLNDAPVDKATYNKYNNYFENVSKCQPCYLKTYDLNEKLILEAVQYTDCIVGFYTEYYPSGSKKSEGHCKENTTGIWKNIFERGLCSQNEGLQTYYDLSGNIIKRVFCKNGNCIPIP